MGATKKHIYTQDQLDLARLFKALSHPARISIVENLLKHENQNCKELGMHIQLAQSTISGHIKELHEAGILGVAVVGNNAYYKVSKDVLKQMLDYVDKLFERADARNETLFAYFHPLKNISFQGFVT